MRKYSRGDKVSDADNQQERPSVEWISGFVDGEGCFHVALNKQPNMSLGWQVLPEFRIVQHKRDEQILHRIRDTLGCGRIVINHGDRLELRVRGMENLTKIVKFFQQHPLQTSKKRNFEIFAKIISLMQEKKHLSEEGMQLIANLASQMNRQTISAYLESSETIRQNALCAKI